MTEVFYEPMPATDGASMNPVPGAVFQVFEISDTTFTTPLSLRVGAGNPTTTVTASETLATLPGVYVTSDNYEHHWVSGSFVWRRDSIDGAKKSIEEAKQAAVDVQTRAQNGEFKGSKGDPGAKGADGANVLPTSQAIAQEITTPGTPAHTALSATTAEQIIEDGLGPTLPQTGAQTYPTPRLQGALVLGSQVGHGWTDTFSEGGSTNLSDTAAAYVGSQSVTRASNGAGGQSRLRWTGATARNYTDHQLRLVIRVDGIDHAGAHMVYAGNNGLADHYVWNVTGGTEVYVDGQWREITLNFADASIVGSPNRVAITDYQVSYTDNSTGSVKFSIARVDAVPEPVREWPTGVCSFSFDDSFSTQTHAIRSMARYDMRGTLYTIAEAVGKPWALTVAQLREAQDDRGWEIASHAATNANHDRYLPALTPQELDVELRTLKEWMVRNGFHAVNHFCYPGGRYNAGVIEAVRRYFPASGRSTFGRQLESAPAAAKHQLRSWTLGPGMTLTAAKERVDKAKAGRGWIHFYGHKFTELGTGGGEWSMSNFTELVNYVQASGMPVLPVGEVLARSYNETANAILRGSLDVGQKVTVRSGGVDVQGGGIRSNGGFVDAEGPGFMGYRIREAGKSVWDIQKTTGKDLHTTAYKDDGSFDFNALTINRATGDVGVGKGDLVHTGGKGPVVWYGATKYRLTVNSSGQVVAVPV